MKSYNDGKQMKDVWLMGRPKKEEKKFGKHLHKNLKRLLRG